MKYQTIQCTETQEKIGIITLNRPEKRNALSIEMRREISECLKTWEGSDEISVVIFVGAGKTFSAGFDLQEFGQPEKLDEIFESSAQYHRDVWSFPKPTIAAVNGTSLGGGFDLATLCDMRICSESAVFGHPEVKFGAPPLFTPLRWIVGHGLARDLCLTGRRIDAAEAHRIGLVSEVVDDQSVLERAMGIGNTILEAPAEALRYTKGYLIGNCGHGFEESFRIEHDKAFKELLLRKQA